MEERDRVTEDELDDYATRLIPRLDALAKKWLELPPEEKHEPKPVVPQKRRRKKASRGYKELEQAWEDRRAERRGF